MRLAFYGRRFVRRLKCQSIFHGHHVTISCVYEEEWRSFLPYSAF
jgi:hypothetical protein